MVDLRRPLGNVYTTLVMAAICGLSLWAVVPAVLASSVSYDNSTVGAGAPIAFAEKTGVLEAQQLPLSILCLISGSLIVLRILGIPFLAMRGWTLNVMVTLSIVALFVMSVVFVTQTIPTFTDACSGMILYIGSGSSSSGTKTVTLNEKYTCFGPSTTYTIFYSVYAAVSALAIVWRFFGGSF